VVEYVPGSDVGTFEGQPHSLLEEFGRGLARIHARRFSECGDPVSKYRYPILEFHARAVRTMRAEVARFWPDRSEVAAALEEMSERLSRPPLPESASLVMTDMDARQFRQDGGRVTAVVDTEAYVLGPRALDCIALEYCLDRQGADAFARGYTEVLPLPNLAPIRAAYRFLYFLFDVQGEEDLFRWMGRPALFG
jgi:Ser/Thr protein kinase RdoA (MazF antagonist)